MNALLLVLAAAASPSAEAASASEVFVAETPGRTQFTYLPDTIRVRRGADGEVRSVTIITHNAEMAPPRATDQIGARAVMEFVCARHAYREVTTTSIKRNGAEVVVMAPNSARPFAETKPDSLERKLAGAVCEVEL
jgi:hypothetical protein